MHTQHNSVMIISLFLFCHFYFLGTTSSPRVAGGPLIQCNFCLNWYHTANLKFSKRQISNITRKNNFQCDNCKSGDLFVEKEEVKLESDDDIVEQSEGTVMPRGTRLISVLCWFMSEGFLFAIRRPLFLRLWASSPQVGSMGPPMKISKAKWALYPQLFPMGMHDPRGCRLCLSTIKMGGKS